jgi:uncharacterized protein YdcH (DUF465 family)
MVPPGLVDRKEVPMDSSRLTALLIDENDEFRALFRDHQSIESRLAAIGSKGFLDSKEELESRLLKKKKLALKDRMAAIAGGLVRAGRI